MRQNHDSILITLSQKTIKERRGGYRQIVDEWICSDGNPQTWWYKSSTAPKDPDRINYVYWVVMGRIRWRSRLAQVKKDSWEKFGGKEPMYSKRWFVMFDFEPVPRKFQLPRTGFQGFRYFDSETINF